MHYARVRARLQYTIQIFVFNFPVVFNCDVWRCREIKIYITYTAIRLAIMTSLFHGFNDITIFFIHVHGRRALFHVLLWAHHSLIYLPTRGPHCCFIITTLYIWVSIFFIQNLIRK